MYIFQIDRQVCIYFYVYMHVRVCEYSLGLAEQAGRMCFIVTLLSATFITGSNFISLALPLSLLVPLIYGRHHLCSKKK